MTAELWYYVHEGATVGPLPRAAIDALIGSGAIRTDTLVSPGGSDWIPAGSSALATAFSDRPISPPPVQRPGFAETLKNPRVLLVIGIVGVLALGYQMRNGMASFGKSELPGDMSVRFMGCTAISTEAMQCGFQNMGAAARVMCLDVVILCNDGRHVASTCSDDMQPGASTVKMVNKFSPALSPTVMCSNVAYENVKTKG